MGWGRVAVAGLLVVALLSVIGPSSCVTVLVGCRYAAVVRDSTGHYRLYLCDGGVMLAVPVEQVTERET